MSNNYWASRNAKTQDNLTKKGVKAIEKEMLKQYDRTAVRLMKGFEDLYKDVEILKGQGKEVSPATLYQMDKYWTMLNRVNENLEKLGIQEMKIMYKNFEKQYKDIYNSIALKSQVAFKTFSEEQMKHSIESIWCADGKSWSDRLWDNRQKLAQTLEDNLNFCVATGKKTSELKKQLQETFQVSYRNADTVVRTEMAHIQTTAAQQRYKDYGVKEVMVWAENCECEECQALHEQKFPINGEMPVPVHPNCRCCVVPVIDE